MGALYQFAGSHYCEKARWALDYKKVVYTVSNLIPGPHISAAKRLAGKSSLPIYVDGATTVQGSAEIITYLDKRSPHPPLTPTNAQDASMAHGWERYLDRNLGVPLRLYFYHHAFKNRALATDFLLRETPRWGRALYLLMYPAVKRAMCRAMNIDAEAAKAARTQIIIAFDKLDERLGSHKYLAGSSFTRADLTAAALLFHRWSDRWPAPPEVDALFSELGQRAAYKWAQEIYRQHRKDR